MKRRKIKQFTLEKIFFKILTFIIFAVNTIKFKFGAVNVIVLTKLATLFKSVTRDFICSLLKKLFAEKERHSDSEILLQKGKASAIQWGQNQPPLLLCEYIKISE